MKGTNRGKGCVGQGNAPAWKDGTEKQHTRNWYTGAWGRELVGGEAPVRDHERECKGQAAAEEGTRNQETS